MGASARHVPECKSRCRLKPKPSSGRVNVGLSFLVDYSTVHSAHEIWDSLSHLQVYTALVEESMVETIPPSTHVEPALA